MSMTPHYPPPLAQKSLNYSSDPPFKRQVIPPTKLSCLISYLSIPPLLYGLFLSPTANAQDSFLPDDRSYSYSINLDEAVLYIETITLPTEQKEGIWSLFTTVMEVNSNV